MLESSGFRKYSTLLVIQLFSRRLCVCHCLCIRLCLCICVPNSFLNSYYHKLSENVWVWGCGASRSEIWSDVTMAGRTNKQGKIELLSQWTMEGWDEQYQFQENCLTAVRDVWGKRVCFACMFTSHGGFSELGYLCLKFWLTKGWKLLWTRDNMTEATKDILLLIKSRKIRKLDFCGPDRRYWTLDF